MNPDIVGGIPLQRIREVFEAECASYVTLHPRSLQLAGHGIAGFFDGVPMHWMRDWSMPFPFVVSSAQGATLHDMDGNELRRFLPRRHRLDVRPFAAAGGATRSRARRAAA